MNLCIYIWFTVNKCDKCDANAHCHRGVCVCKNFYVGDGYSCTFMPPAQFRGMYQKINHPLCPSSRKTNLNHKYTCSEKIKKELPFCCQNVSIIGNFRKCKFSKTYFRAGVEQRVRNWKHFIGKKKHLLSRFRASYKKKIDPAHWANMKNVSDQNSFKFTET